MAENDGRLYITISKQKPSNKVSDDSSGNGEAKDSVSLKTFAANQLANLITRETKKSLNYAISNVGTFTGDHRLQQDVQEAFAVGEAVSQVGMAFVSGTLLTENPIGGLITATINVAGQITNYGLSEQQAIFAVKRNNYEIEQLRNVSGMNALKDGSRGTEN